MKTLFAVTAALTLLLGVAWTAAPAPLLSLWGVQADPVAVYMGRRYGGLFFGYAVLMWLARAAEASSARTAIVAGGAVVASVMAVVSLAGALTGVVGPGVWAAFVIEVLLAAGFVYVYLTAR